MTDPVPVPDAAPSWPGFVRTGTTTIVGAVVAILANHGMHVSAADQTAALPLLTAFFGFLYYVLVRLLEKSTPALGWLLGSPHPPVYPTAYPLPPTPVVPPVPAPVPPEPEPAPASEPPAPPAMVTKPPAKRPARKAPAKKAAPRKAPAAKKAPARKAPAKKATAKKAGN